MTHLKVYNSKATKAKMNKLNIKLLSFCITKETINNMERQPTKQEKIFAKSISDMELISKIYKELKSRKPQTVVPEDLNGHFSKEHIQTASEYVKNMLGIANQFNSVQSLSHVWRFATPWTAACRASLSITNSRSPPRPMSIELKMPSNHLILYRPLLLLPSIFPSIRVFSNESALRIRWPEYWSFSFNISPSPQDWSPLG